jgi:hypothetical protein
MSKMKVLLGSLIGAAAIHVAIACGSNHAQSGGLGGTTDANAAGNDAEASGGSSGGSGSRLKQYYATGSDATKLYLTYNPDSRNCRMVRARGSRCTTPRIRSWSHRAT